MDFTVNGVQWMSAGSCDCWLVNDNGAITLHPCSKDCPTAKAAMEAAREAGLASG